MPRAAQEPRTKPAADGDARERRLVRGQALFREVNEQIYGLAQQWLDGGDLDLVCECSSGACMEKIAMTAADYEAVRRFPTRFVVKAGHVVTEYERIAEDRGAFLVIEKIGAGAADAIRYEHRNGKSAERVSVRTLED